VVVGSGYHMMTEGQEKEEFWNVLGGKGDYSNSPRLQVRSTTARTRHRASTSMYSLTFCVRFLLSERHQWKPAVQTAVVMLSTPPSTASHRRASHAHFPYTPCNFENAPHHLPVSGQQRAQTPPSRPFALCRHIAGWTQACN